RFSARRYLIFSLLTRVREFARRFPLFQSFHLSVLHNELIDVIGEERRAELHTLEMDELLRRRAGERNRKPRSRLVAHFKFYFAWRQVHARELFQKARVDRFGLARERDFRLVQRDHGGINVSLRVGTEVDRELAILLVVRCVEPVVMEVAHRKVKLVQTELQLMPLQSDFQNAVSRAFIFANVVAERVRWFRVRYAIPTGLRARFRPSFLVGKPLLKLPL